jgi:hypothetical protein
LNPSFGFRQFAMLPKTDPQRLLPRVLAAIHQRVAEGIRRHFVEAPKYFR